MRVSILPRLFLTISFFALACLASSAQGVSIDEAAKVLPERVGQFRAQGKPKQLPPDIGPVKLEDFYAVPAGVRDYVGPRGEKFTVSVVKTSSSPAAYSLLRYFGGEGESVPYRFRTVEGLGVVGDGGPRLKFIKGASVVHVSSASAQTDSPEAVLGFARQLAEAVEGEAGEIPVLVQHLPEWERVNDLRSGYAVSLPVLKSLVRPDEGPALDAVSFEGGTEAAVARYDDAQLVIVEFTTPQYSVDNDARITQRIAELRGAGQRVPASYRRVGNYSVFVFGAADEGAAAGLIDQVKYEKDVRWLGDNPHVYAQAEKFYRMTMGGVVITTLKTTGLAILACLAVGGIFGGVIFLRRRARSTAEEAYTDAGGMLRLNIEDAKIAADSSKLLGGAGKR